MANKQNGEVSIVVEGTVYTMALTMDSMIALEELFSTPEKLVTFQEVVQLADEGSIKHLRAMLWASLLLHHPETKLEGDVSKLVHRAGGLGVFAIKFMELAKESFADPKDLKTLGINPNANPRPARATRAKHGTGVGSTSKPGALA